MKFSKLGAALVVSTLISQVSFAHEMDGKQEADLWISSSQLQRIAGHNNHNHNNNHNGGNNHQSFNLDENSIATSMLA